MLLSVVVALVLTPVLCATFLKPVPKGHQPSESVVFFLRPFFRVFNKVFNRVRSVYIDVVGHSFAKWTRYIAVYVLLVVAVAFLFKRMAA